MLLAESREDEIRIRNWQKIALRLGAFGHAATKNAAIPHCDQRLPYLISGAAWVIIGIDETGQPGFLIRLQHLAAGPDARHQGETDEASRKCPQETAPPAESGNR